MCIWDLNPKAGNTDLVPPIQPLPYEPGPRRPATTLPTLNVMNEKKEAGESARVVKFNPRYAMFASAGADAVSLSLSSKLRETCLQLCVLSSGIMASEKRCGTGRRGHEYGLDQSLVSLRRRRCIVQIYSGSISDTFHVQICLCGAVHISGVGLVKLLRGFTFRRCDRQTIRRGCILCAR